MFLNGYRQLSGRQSRSSSLFSHVSDKKKGQEHAAQPGGVERSSQTKRGFVQGSYLLITPEAFEERSFRASRRKGTAAVISLFLHLVVLIICSYTIKKNHPEVFEEVVPLKVEVLPVKEKVKEKVKPQTPMFFLKSPSQEVPNTPAPQKRREAPPLAAAPPKQAASSPSDEVPSVVQAERSLPPVELSNPTHTPSAAPVIANAKNQPLPRMSPPSQKVVERPEVVTTVEQFQDQFAHLTPPPIATAPPSDPPRRSVGDAGTDLLGGGTSNSQKGNRAGGGGRNRTTGPGRGLVDAAGKARTHEAGSDFGAGTGSDSPDVGDGEGQGGGNGEGGYGPDGIVGRGELASLLKQGNDMERARVGNLKVIFLLDQSGSMEDGNKFGLAKSALKDAIANLNEKDRFYLILFDSHLHPYPKTYEYANQASKQQASDHLDRQTLGTGTNISACLENALNQQPEAVIIWLISDGEPTEGTTDIDAILRMVQSRNRGTRIQTIGLGRGNAFRGADFLWRLAHANNGKFRGIDITRY